MQPQDLLACDTDSDGFSVFDLTSQNEDILNGLSEMDFTISYHLSLDDAQNGSNALDTNFTNTETQQTIYVRLENINTNCFNTTQFDVIVNEQPVLLMNDLWIICKGESVDIVADEGYDEYVWSTGETTQSITVDTPGIYEITVTNVYGILRCETNKTITVKTERQVSHPLYKKYYKVSKKITAHDENNECGEGDTVRVQEMRPLSKSKRWNLINIVDKAK
jgi:ribosomal protein uS17